MGGIADIKKAEKHRKRLKHLHKSKRGCFSSQSLIGPCDTKEFCDEDSCEYINEIQESFIKNGRVPQIVDTDIYKHF